MTRYAVLFPGQGSQKVGMGADLFDRRPDLLGPAADAVLGWSLREVCLSGPEEELTRTDRVQPALYALAYALWDELAAAVPHPPVAAAGHSLGEYTALAASGALDYTAGLRLVAARGAAMAEAAAVAPSGMVALLGVDAELAEAICLRRRAEGGRIWVANLNAPGQVVLAGARGDVEWVVAHARELGARRGVPLKVAGAFHTPFMAPAAERLAAALADVDLGESGFPVYANVSAEPIADPRRQLVEQLTAPVRFAESLTRMAADQGVEVFVHVGPGDVTAGLVRRTVPDAEVIVVSDLGALGTAVDRLSVP